jgi:hypothetical protein
VLEQGLRRANVRNHRADGTLLNRHLTDSFQDRASTLVCSFIETHQKEESIWLLHAQTFVFKHLIESSKRFKRT